MTDDKEERTLKVTEDERWAIHQAQSYMAMKRYAETRDARTNELDKLLKEEKEISRVLNQMVMERDDSIDTLEARIKELEADAPPKDWKKICESHEILLGFCKELYRKLEEARK